LIAAIAVLATVAGAGRGGVGVARAATNAASSSGRGLDVLPFPGTPDAAPGTNIVFPAVSPGEMAAVNVVGSRSGRHTGRLSAQPSGHGSAFSPSRPFAPGERVSVSALVRSAAAAASGAPGSRELHFSFSVARSGSFAASNAPSASADSLGVASPRTAANAGAKTHTFVTEPGLTPPVVTISGRDTDQATGDIFLTAQNTGQDGPYILDPRGDLLWYEPADEPSAFNLRVQSYAGQPVLTYWEGHVVCPPCSGKGEDPILNEHYQKIHTVTAGNGYQSQGTDLHEFTLGHEGSETTAFVTIWKPVQADLRSVGGPPNGIVFDWIIQEIDVNTNQVLWEWHALGHVPIKDSYARYVQGQPFDYFHLNSIQQLSNGEIIISARHTWAVYAINKATGKITWELGGKHSSFKMGPGTGFEWQHDATLHSNGLVTLFDDAGGPGPEPERQSRALEVHISLTKHQATLVHAYTHQPSVRASSMGSTEALDNHDAFVGWGNRRYFSEYTATGKEIFGGSFGPGVTSYRAYRFGNWVGSPLQPPAIVVRKSSTRGRDSVYASWNGATTVAKWQVLGSASASGRFSKVGSAVPWTSFQANISVPASAGPYFEVEALNASGRLIAGGTSKVVKGP
jgi:hypothetical protein